jgi:hypothetical protein
MVLQFQSHLKLIAATTILGGVAHLKQLRTIKVGQEENRDRLPEPPTPDAEKGVAS